MSRYLVTGATGFLGGHLCAALRDKGHDVVALVRSESDALAALKNGDDARSLLEKKALKPQFVTLDRPNGRWALYDSNNDGKLDLALFGKRPSERDEPYGGASSYVTDALDLSGPQPKRAIGYVGRSIVRPKLIADEKARRLSSSRTSDDGRATFPKAIALVLF